MVAKKTVAKKAPVKKTATKKAPVAKKQASDAISPLCKTLGAILDDNKAEDITMLNLKDKCSFADFMIVASGRSSRHVSALAHYVVDGLKKAGQQPMSVEGRETGDWVLIDAGNIVVHVFRPEIRQFYNIEKMWALPAISG
ncbi:MAG: ribosome silencing factor [Rickettsiales bacterium]